jgi:hypothetical protein
MRTHLTPKIAAALLLLAGSCATTWAEETTVLKGNKVTESNLLEALTPAPEPVLTRRPPRRRRAPRCSSLSRPTPPTSPHPPSSSSTWWPQR